MSGKVLSGGVGCGSGVRNSIQNTYTQKTNFMLEGR